MFVFALLTSLVAVPIISHAQAVQTGPSVSIQNITTSSATLTFVTGTDTLGSFIGQRQPLKIKYRAVPTESNSVPTINGTEKELSLQYTVDSSNPLNPVTLTNLQQNKRYAIWFGHQAIRSCVTDTPCTAIYTNYDSDPLFFSTKLDPSRVLLLNKNLSFQTKSSDVVLLKKYLSAHNFMNSSTSKTFDIPTLVGVIKFQIANNLTTDGTVGSGSRSIINQWLVQVAQN